MSMMTDLLLFVDAMSRERGVEKEVIFEALELALASVTAKSYDEGALITVSIDRNTAEQTSYRVWDVVADDVELEEPAQQITLTAARDIDESLSVGDTIKEEIESEGFGRIDAQQAKQVLIQKVREAERRKVISQYELKMGSLLTGVVKRVTREYALLDMGNSAEALLSRDHMLPRDAFRMNDRVRCCLVGLSEERRGPQLIVSRTCKELLVELFKIEVPEIGEEVIEVKAAARDPGQRAKIAVKTNDGRIDAIGACVGMRGARVQAVSNELGGERIDIALWDDNPAQLAIHAMSPAEVSFIMVDEEARSMDIVVSEEQLSQAIGRNGQNVRLASELTGWILNLMTQEQADEKQKKEVTNIQQLFVEHLSLSEDDATALVEAGLTTIEEVAYIPPEELEKLIKRDAEYVEELQAAASDYMLISEIAQEEELSHHQPAEDLLAVDGMTKEWAFQMAASGVVTKEDLAELAIDELTEMISIEEEAAGQMIMAARSHWFSETDD